MTPARTRLLLFGCCLALGVAFAGAAELSRQQRAAALSDNDRVWLTVYVSPIILPEEEKVFFQLTDAAQREGFKEDFWQRREKPGLPPPFGPGYRDRYRDLRQIIDGKYIGWETDVGKLILRRGEPDSIFKPQCGGTEVLRDVEVWTYSGLELNGHAAARHILYRPAPRTPQRLWIIHEGNAAVFQPNACRASFDQLSRDCRPSREDPCGRCEDRCVVYEAWAEILKRQGGPAGALAEQGELFNYPKIPTEGLDRSKAHWAVPAVSSAKPPAAGGTTPAPTPTAVRRPTVTPTPTAVRPPTPTPAPQATRPPTAPERTPAPARPTPAPTRAPTLAATPRPAAAPALTPAPAVQGLRRLSPEEIRDRLATLEPEYKEFLDLAKPFLTEDDLSRFLQLSGHDKDTFIREFWKRHS